MIQTRTRMQEEEDISQLCTFRTFQCLMSSVLIVIFRDLNSLIDFFSFTTWIFYTLAFASYFALRYKEPHAERPFRVRIGTCPLRMGARAYKFASFLLPD